MIGLGAEQVVTDLSQVDEPVDLVLDNVGGPQLVAAWGLLAPGGSVAMHRLALRRAGHVPAVFDGRRGASPRCHHRLDQNAAQPPSHALASVLH